MTRLFRLMLVLIAVHVVLISVAHLVTRDQHPSFLDLFTKPDGTPCEQPCLLGIRPGETSMDEALTLLQRHWLLSDVQTVKGSYGLHVLATAKGEYSGKHFLIWLGESFEEQTPLQIASIEFGIRKSAQDQLSDYEIPITSSGTLMTLFGQPEIWDASESFYANSFTTHDFYFTKQRIRATIALLHQSIATIHSYTIKPSPSDTVLSFVIYDSRPRNWLRENKWCGFTLRTCEPTN